jgi:hypothetical protein
MAKSKNITASIPTQTTAIAYDRKPNSKAPCTPASEYAFMRQYSLICAPQTNGSFGPFGGGVAQ